MEQMCHRCSSNIEANDDFCPFCGYQARLKCPSCGGFTRRDGICCASCGESLVTPERSAVLEGFLKAWRDSKAAHAVAVEGKSDEDEWRVQPCLALKARILSHFRKPGELLRFIEKPLFLPFDLSGASAKEGLPLLEELARTGRDVLILASNVSSRGDMLATLIVNSVRGILKSVIVEAREASSLKAAARILGCRVFMRGSGPQGGEAAYASADLAISGGAVTLLVNPVGPGGTPAMTTEKVLVCEAGAPSVAAQALKIRLLNTEVAARMAEGA